MLVIQAQLRPVRLELEADGSKLLAIVDGIDFKNGKRLGLLPGRLFFMSKIFDEQKAR